MPVAPEPSIRRKISTGGGIYCNDAYRDYRAGLETWPLCLIRLSGKRTTSGVLHFGSFEPTMTIAIEGERVGGGTTSRKKAVLAPTDTRQRKRKGFANISLNVADERRRGS
jgi:hypothetical protein